MWKELENIFNNHNEISFDPKWQASVSLILKDKNNPKLLIIKRSTREDDPWSGHYGLPGGVVEKNESLLQAAIRECHEELSLSLDAHHHIGQLDQLQVHKNKKPLPFLIHPFVFAIDERHPLNIVKEESEVEQYYWLELQKVFHEDSMVVRNFSFGQENRDLPAIEVDGHVIWGITYKILGSFLRPIYENSANDDSLKILEFLPESLAFWQEYY
ncbi:MAG: CoA pyrophosphatase [Oligoflexia bacterium]|nr:CoA pyrophosphatase [Oligoflexia bacterium]